MSWNGGIEIKRNQESGIMDRIGVFGGTFDPPHIGHLALASKAKYQLELDRILWVLTSAPPISIAEKLFL